MYILDNHMHLRPDGENVEAVRKFERAGGTHIILAHIPYRDVQIVGPESYRESFDRTLEMAERVRAETKVKVFVTVGPYPVDLLHMSERMPLNEATEIMKNGMDIAAGLFEEGSIIAIGEIGRPHFEVSERVMEASNDILRYGMERAKDVDCPVVLHTESATVETFKEFAEMADQVGLERERVVKHFCPPIVDTKENHGLFPSVLGSKKNMVVAIEQSNRFLMETDYIDDPRRPGVVLGPSTIPKTTHSMLKEGLFTEEDVTIIHKTNPEKVYRISMD